MSGVRSGVPWEGEGGREVERGGIGSVFLLVSQTVSKWVLVVSYEVE